MTTPYDYKREVLHRYAAPSSVAATPDISAPSKDFAAASGSVNAADAALQRDVAYSTSVLNEKDREFNVKLAADRAMLDDWAQQNRWASAIALGNLGITGLAIPVNLAAAEKQEAHQVRLGNLAEENVTALRQNNSLRQSQLESWERDRAAWLKKAAAVPASHAVNDVAYSTPVLNEKDREFNVKLTADRAMLDDWAQQNRWASVIALGNLGVPASNAVTGYSGGVRYPHPH